MEEKDILTAITDTIIDKPKHEITIPVTWHPPVKRTWLDRVLRRPLPVKEAERTFVIYPCKVGNMYRIAGRAAQLPAEVKEGTNAEVVLPLIHKHLKDVVYVVAAGIQNNHLEPDPELITFIEMNFDAADLYSCLDPVLESVGMQSFFNTIVLVMGTVKILKPEETSPIDGSE